ncbi:hypothetical protein L1987_16161 [Smallanthus sonchifolius]|uniref:Uncharacterized protein n=1 Tax=Smallanthus sonchifolius TaxID=185202 RepID=A0ACB9J939_9ASTR|nr:hypothetical protein L1987_16161 [Smallanthus sonchifolius]
MPRPRATISRKHGYRGELNLGVNGLPMQQEKAVSVAVVDERVNRVVTAANRAYHNCVTFPISYKEKDGVKVL